MHPPERGNHENSMPFNNCSVRTDPRRKLAFNNQVIWGAAFRNEMEENAESGSHEREKGCYIIFSAPPQLSVDLENTPVA
jgi:hypothetical protein